MSSSTPLIGFDRYVALEWCRASFDVAIGNISSEQLLDLVATTLPGKESQRKTVDILKRISIKPFPQLTDFIARGLAIYRDALLPSVLPIAWGGALASYPFFGKSSEITGRLLLIQGDCSIKEIQRRMAEAYGDRNGIERAAARVLQSQANWMAINRDEDAKRIVKLDPMTIDNDELAAWLIEATVRYSGKSLSVPTLQSVPVLFPFTLTQHLNYVISNSPNLELRSEGPSCQFVALRASV